MNKKSLLTIAIAAVVFPSVMILSACGNKTGGGEKNALSGAGTITNPFLIENAADLDKITKENNSEYMGQDKHFKLTADITNYQTNETGNTFSGTLIGNNKKISFSGTSGLFNKNEGIIKDLIVEGTLNASGNSADGMIANVNGGTISNVKTLGTVNNSSTRTELEEVKLGGAAGIVGRNLINATIVNSTNEATINSPFGGAGIVSFNEGTVEKCYNYGQVGLDYSEAAVGDTSANYNFMGGICAVNRNLIKQVYTKCNVVAPKLADANPNIGSKYIGGVVGYNSTAQSKITEAFASFGSSLITFGDYYVGGIAGYSEGTIEYSYGGRKIGGRSNIGAVVGEMGSYAVVDRCVGAATIENTTTDITTVAYEIAPTATNSIYAGNKGSKAPEGENNVSEYRVARGLNDILLTNITPNNVLHKDLIEIDYKFATNTSGKTSANPALQLAWMLKSVTFINGDVTTVGTYSIANDFEGKTIEVSQVAGKEFKGWVTDLNNPEQTIVWNAQTINITVLNDITVYAYFVDVIVE